MPKINTDPDPRLGWRTGGGRGRRGRSPARLLLEAVCVDLMKDCAPAIERLLLDSACCYDASTPKRAEPALGGAEPRAGVEMLQRKPAAGGCQSTEEEAILCKPAGSSRRIT